MFKVIDVENWNRKNTYEFFRDFEDPFFNMTAELDVTRLYEFTREKGFSFSISCLYFSQVTANSIEEFRTRLLDGRPVIFDRIHASQTILLEDETFAFCFFEWFEDPGKFDKKGRQAVKKYRALRSFDVESDRIDLIYYSVIPWVSFTSFKHASRIDRSRTVPRIVFGKMSEKDGGRKIPVSVEANHMVMDGIHVGKYLNRFQERINSL